MPDDRLTDAGAVPGLGWASRRVMVTGANGFIGRWLTRALVGRGAAVTAVVHRPVAPPSGGDALHGAAVAVGNVADADFIGRTVRDAGIDTVFHLAAVNVNRGSALEPRALFDAHLHGACSVLEACRRRDEAIRIVLSSSREVEDCLLPEATRQVHPYMASKAAAELIARAYHDTFDSCVVVLRAQNVYGGGDINWDRLVPGAVRSLLHGEQPVIKGTGRLLRDFVHVDDAVDAYLAAAEAAALPHVRGQVFRIATGIVTEIVDAVRLLAQACGRDDVQPVVLGGLKNDRVDRHYVPDREREVLGWSSRIGLRDGLARTVAWYAAYFHQAAASRAESLPGSCATPDGLAIQ